MKINIIVKVLLVKGLLVCPLAAFAWTVSEHVSLESEQAQVLAKPMAAKEEPDILKESSLAPVVDHLLTESDKPNIFEKKPTKMSIEERVFLDYQRALGFLKTRDFVQAETLLMANLNQLPNHHASRVELATHYLKNHQIEEAENLLHEGLRFDENHPEFLRLTAVVCDMREEPEKALNLLMKVQDSKRQDSQYVSFLGHIYQQLGSYALARQQYYRLLQNEPNNPLWLLGVSVALDSEGQKEAALEGYHRLSVEGNFEPDVRQYILDRIQTLKG